MPELQTEVVDNIPESTHSGKGSKYDAILNGALDAGEGKAVAVKNPGKSLRNTLYQIIRRRKLDLKMSMVSGVLYVKKA